MTTWVEFLACGDTVCMIIILRRTMFFVNEMLQMFLICHASITSQNGDDFLYHFILIANCRLVW